MGTLTASYEQKTVAIANVLHEAVHSWGVEVTLSDIVNFVDGIMPPLFDALEHGLVTPDEVAGAIGSRFVDWQDGRLGAKVNENLIRWEPIMSNLSILLKESHVPS